MQSFNRRQFLQTSAAVGISTFAISGTKSSGNVLGANDRVRVGIAGLNGRGKSHMGELSGRKDDVEIAYLIDPDQRTWPSALKSVTDKGHTPQTVADIRAALEDKNLDAVTVATPNHWHALITIWACEAGKDVYVEKPCSHNVHEGRIAVEMARKHQRIVQHGTQSRSSGSWDNITAVARSGHYGDLKVARAFCYKNRGSIGMKDVSDPPKELDFNIWLGPAPKQPFHGNLVHYNWHWFWGTGNGDIGNQGVHQMDIARWGIKGATLPKSVVSVGGRFGYTDQGQTANTQISIMDFGGPQLIFEVRGLPTPDRLVTNRFEFADGYIKEDGKFYKWGSEKGEAIPKLDNSRGPGGGHFGNFIAAVKSRKQSDLNADILDGHYSSALCHLANISYRLGTEGSFATKADALRGDKAGIATFEKMEEHLSAENKIKLSDIKCRFGRALAVDAAKEAFTSDAEANALLTRNYRAPFVVPEKVA